MLDCCFGQFLLIIAEQWPEIHSISSNSAIFIKIPMSKWVKQSIVSFFWNYANLGLGGKTS